VGALPDMRRISRTAMSSSSSDVQLLTRNESRETRADRIVIMHPQGTMVVPEIPQSSRRGSRKPSVLEGNRPLHQDTHHQTRRSGHLLPGAALARCGHAVAPPRTVMKSRRLIWSPRLLLTPVPLRAKSPTIPGSGRTCGTSQSKGRAAGPLLPKPQNE
jgi:hypothetical protein